MSFPVADLGSTSVLKSASQQSRPPVPSFVRRFSPATHLRCAKPGNSREDEMDADEFIARLTPVVEYRGTAAAAQAEPLLQWFRVLCTRILEEPHPAVVALEQRYNPERDLNKV